MIRTLAISAYLSTVLALSVSSIRSEATLDTSLNAEMVKILVESNGGPDGTVATKTPAPIPVAFLTSAEENIGAFDRLRAFTLNHPSSARLGAGAMYYLGFPKKDVLTRQTSSAIPDGKCYFSVSLANNDDIFLIVKRTGTPLTLYLTNSKLEWRAAAIDAPGKPHALTKEESASGFQALLEFWIENAKTLPPSTTPNYQGNHFSGN